MLTTTNEVRNATQGQRVPDHQMWRITKEVGAGVHTLVCATPARSTHTCVRLCTLWFMESALRSAVDAPFFLLLICLTLYY